MSKLLLVVGPMLVRLLSKKVATDLLATVLNTVIDKVQAKLVAKLPAAVQATVNQAIDEVQAELLSDGGLADLLKLVTGKVEAGPTAPNR